LDSGRRFRVDVRAAFVVKVEYLYYDLGSVTYNSLLVDRCIPTCVGGVQFFTNNVQTTTRFNGNIVRAGVN
jgi:outer membrane immunogenic protein